MMEKEPKVKLDIAWRTIIKVLLALLLAFVAIRLWPLLQLVIVSVLLAVPLYRLVLWACKKGWPRWTGLLLASLTLVCALLGLAALAGPVAFSQASHLDKNLPKLKEQLVSHLPAGPVRNTVEQVAGYWSSAALQRSAEKGLAAAKATASAFLALVLVVALTIYMLADGPRALKWLITFFPRGQRARVTKGLEKIGERGGAYIVGQSIVSGLFAAFALVVLSVLHVPMAPLLAVLAGFLDVVPVLGISTVLVLAGAMALAGS